MEIRRGPGESPGPRHMLTISDYILLYGLLDGMIAKNDSGREPLGKSGQ